MNTKQEAIERDVRITLGDLQLQIIMLRAELQDVRDQLDAERGKAVAEAMVAGKINGSRPHKEANP